MPLLLAQFVHDINPLMFEFGTIRLWYYGTAYAIGFIGVFAWLWLKHRSPGLRREDALGFSLLFALCVLICGRVFEIVAYEGPFYVRHPELIPCFWLGGMASHGVLLGGAIAIALYAFLSRRSFFQLADEIAVPAAVFLALGRIGNFISGDILALQPMGGGEFGFLAMTFTGIRLRFMTGSRTFCWFPSCCLWAKGPVVGLV